MSERAVKPNQEVQEVPMTPEGQMDPKVAEMLKSSPVEFEWQQPARVAPADPKNPMAGVKPLQYVPESPGDALDAPLTNQKSSQDQLSVTVHPKSPKAGASVTPNPIAPVPDQQSHPKPRASAPDPSGEPEVDSILASDLHHKRAINYAARAAGISMHLLSTEIGTDIRQAFNDLLDPESLADAASALTSWSGGVWGPQRRANAVLHLFASKAILSVLEGKV